MSLRTRATRRLVLGLAVWLIALPAHPQTPVFGLTDAQKIAVDQIAASVLSATSTPSASLAVVKDGQIAYVQAYGDAQVSPRLPATPQMRYAIGSVSKQFTAVAILMLAEEGKLSVDEPIARWYPAVTAADRITLRHLLSHTSGIADYWPQDYVMPQMTGDVDPETIISSFAKRPLQFQPGERYEYSNTGFVIAGRIAEMVSQKPLFALLQERVFTPLGMASVVNFDQQGLSHPPDARGYRRGALAPPRPSLKQGSGWGLGAFELAMTAEDLAKWNVALLERRLLNAGSYEQLFNSAKLSNGRDAGYSLGLSVSNAGGRKRVGHGGEVSGFMAQNTLWVNDRAAVTVFATLEAAPGASNIASQIGQVLFPTTATVGPPPVVPPALPPQAETPEGRRVRTLLASLQKGQPDRTLMTGPLNAYFDRDLLGDFASSLAPLGDIKTVQNLRQFRRGGMTGGDWRVTFADRAVEVSTYVTDEGKFEQFLVFP